MFSKLRKESFLSHVGFLLVLSFAFLPAVITAQENNEEKVDISQIVVEKIKSDGAKSGLELYEQYDLQGEDKYVLGENVLNTVGIRLFRGGIHDDAFIVIRYAIAKYPESANLMDTLAEAYLYKYNNKGDIADLETAENYYNEALEIEPEFNFSVRALKKIFVIKNYDKREYMVPMRDGVKLFTQVYTRKNKSEMYPFLLERTPYNASPKGHTVHIVPVRI